MSVSWNSGLFLTANISLLYISFSDICTIPYKHLLCHSVVLQPDDSVYNFISIHDYECLILINLLVYMFWLVSYHQCFLHIILLKLNQAGQLILPFPKINILHCFV
jgi:hypothetical protein